MGMITYIQVLIISDHDSLNNDAGVTSVAISPGGHFVAAGSRDAVVRIWDVATGILVQRVIPWKGEGWAWKWK